MKKYIYIAIAIAAVALLATIGIQRARIQSLLADRDAYRTSSEALLRDVEHYKTSDGLNAAKVQQMQLTMDELKKYRTEDAETIRTLKADTKRISSVVTMQTQTIYELKMQGRDSVVINTETHTVDTLRCVEYRDEWLDFVGCFDRAWNFTGNISERVAITIVESWEAKRFLGFLWKTNRVKRRELDAVTKNPRTDITELEFISIRK